MFFINPENKLMLNMTYPACVGRNMDEVIRCMKALQLSYNRAIATPADWPCNHAEVKLPDGTTTTEYKGSVFLLPAVTKEEGEEHYQNYHTCDLPSKKEYLRLVKAEDVGTVPTCEVKNVKAERKQEGWIKEEKRRRKQVQARVRRSRGIIYWFWRKAGQLKKPKASTSTSSSCEKTKASASISCGC